MIEADLRKMVSVFPNASYGIDNDGQIVIYTNLTFYGAEIVEIG